MIGRASGLAIGAIVAIYVSSIFWDFSRWDSVLVSVVVPCYNCREDWLQMTLATIERQTMVKDIEIILLDDGSKDASSLHRILKMGWNRPITLYQHWRNRGLSAARNTGAVLAKGQYIIYLDPDDLIEREAIEKLFLKIKMYEKIPESRVSYVYPSVAHFDSDIKKPFGIERSLFDGKRLLRENFIPSFALIERSTYLRLGGMCEDHVQYFEDYDFWLRLLGIRRRGVLLDEALLHYRRHDGGRSSRIRSTKVDWKLELKRCNPMAYNNIPYYEDEQGNDDVKLAPCLRPIPDLGIIGLFLWRSHISIPLWLSNRKLSSFWPSQQEPIDILMLIPWMQIGGADYYDLDVLRTLKGMGLKVMIVTDVVRSENPLLPEFKRYANQIFHLSTLLPPSYDQKDVDELLDLFIATRTPRIIYIRNSLNGYRLASRHPGIKVIDLQHLSNPYDNLGWEYSSIPFKSFLTERVVVSSHLKEVVEGLQDQDDLPIHVISPSVNMTFLQESIKLPSSPCNSHTETIIFVGRMCEQKDPLKWIQVAKQLHIQDPSRLFLMIGDGELVDQVKFELNNHLHGNSLLLPFLSRVDLAKYLYFGLVKDNSGVLRQGICCGKTLLLMTSKYEGFPFTIIEASALGVPSIIPRIDAEEEINQYFENWVTVVDEALVEKFVKASDWVLRQQKTNSLFKIHPKFQSQHFHNSFKSVINRLI